MARSGPGAVIPPASPPVPGRTGPATRRRPAARGGPGSAQAAGQPGPRPPVPEGCGAWPGEPSPARAAAADRPRPRRARPRRARPRRARPRRARPRRARPRRAHRRRAARSRGLRPAARQWRRVAAVSSPAGGRGRELRAAPCSARNRNPWAGAFRARPAVVMAWDLREERAPACLMLYPAPVTFLAARGDRPG